jgi:aryl-alcohol dehydrogenase-like predicted oxidoreductase
MHQAADDRYRQIGDGLLLADACGITQSISHTTSRLGSAEENFGRILATDLAGYRDELIISTKAGYLMWPGPYGEWGSRKYLLASLDQSLLRMGLESVDIFYSHRYDPNTPRIDRHARDGDLNIWAASSRAG